MLPNKLRNQYFAVRHGESEANIAHLISSNPTVGIDQHGLTSNGRTQVIENVKLFLKNHPSNKSFVIVSSDFRRARETAEILSGNLSNSFEIQYDIRLRERFFGIYDGENDDNYHFIWANDEKNFEKNISDLVESVDNVRQRTTNLINELDKKYENQIIFLVSHGDSLQILQTAFERLSNANQQRHLKHIERAEIRELILK